jgi:hypothetical protein
MLQTYAPGASAGASRPTPVTLLLPLAKAVLSVGLSVTLEMDETEQAGGCDPHCWGVWEGLASPGRID